MASLPGGGGGGGGGGEGGEGRRGVEGGGGGGEGESRAAADWLLTVAWHLATRLGGTLDALAGGIITRPKAELIVRLTQHLDDDEPGGRG